jgi:cytochrome c oxidase subunit IV
MNTNVWDFLSIAATLSYLLAVFGGTAYMVEKYNWSPWWFLLALALGSIKVKTGG